MNVNSDGQAVLLAVLAFSCALPATAGDAVPANLATALELPRVNVVGTTPLPGLGTPLEQVPANVQSATGEDLEREHTLDLADFMNQTFGGVFVNETQDNPFQPDVNYRGFTASPLLGTPQGLSVYVDGVRVNESFGDVVNWDLIPQSAIANVSLMPGSNPLFGLNTLGGALSVQTKSGKQSPGTSVQAYGGSFGRRAAEFETGGSLGGFDYFLSGNWFDEDGWRDLSPSHVRQLFGKLGWEDEKTDVDLSYAWADTNLTGNGLAPVSMIEQRREAVFTAPDNTKNHANFVNLRAGQFLQSDLLLAGNVYYRQLITQTYNGDVNDDYADDFEDADCDDDPGSGECEGLAARNGVNNHTRTAQHTYGGTLQLTYSGDLFARKNQFTAGSSYDRGRSDFTQEAQEAMLTPQRTTVATDGFNRDVSLYGSGRGYGVYATDILSPSEWLHLTASLRYNHMEVALQDRLGTGLNGDHSFHRLNPAFGFTLTPSKALTLYADYNQGNRAPTPIELGCADPTQPCKLPNAFAADPALRQVVAKTWEVGGRGSLIGKALNWNAALFQTVSEDDIQFISSSISGAGYFDNVGRTRRQGAELGLHGEWRRFKWRANYSFVDATYRSAFSVMSENNSTADANGFIAVSPGDRIPLIPRHTGKLIGEYGITPVWSVDADLVIASGAFVRGNENNLHQQGINADSETFNNSGRIGGYAVLNIRSRYAFARHWEAFARVNNVLDRRYATSGQLTVNPFDAAGQFQPNPDDWHNVTAISPAAPIGVWAGLRVRLD
jgi:outer membrane receptor protein involved in Fe transport